MTFNRLAVWLTTRVFSTALAAFATAATGVNAAAADPLEAPSAVESLYAQGTAMIQNVSSSPVAVQGMQLTLPHLSKEMKYALVTFSAPNLLGDDESICSFSILGGTTQYGSGVSGGFDGGSGEATQYMPLSITTKIPLGRQAQMLQVYWSAFAASGPTLCQLNTFYSLSAILTSD
jgi:hypothetical protein